MSDSPLVELAGLSVSFGSRSDSARRVDALRDVSLTIDERELVILVGESGSGKTTLGRVVAGLQRPTVGTMMFRGVDMDAAGKSDYLRYRRGVQLVHQDPYTSLNPSRTVEQSLIPGITRWNPDLGKEDARRQAQELMTLVGLSRTDLQKYPHQLSGGQRQRVAIARSISLSPELIVLDEPVTMVDASLRIGILDTLLDIRRRLGTAYLFITHDLAIAKYFCEKGQSGRVVVLYGGFTMEIGPYKSIIESASNPYTMMLLAASAGFESVEEALGDDPYGSKETVARPLQGCAFSPRCHYVQEVCRTDLPRLTPVEAGHSSACHFAGSIGRDHAKTAPH